MVTSLMYTTTHTYYEPLQTGNCAETNAIIPFESHEVYPIIHLNKKRTTEWGKKRESKKKNRMKKRQPKMFIRLNEKQILTRANRSPEQRPEIKKKDLYIRKARNDNKWYIHIQVQCTSLTAWTWLSHQWVLILFLTQHTFRSMDNFDKCK